MIYIKLIWEIVQANVIAILIGIGGLLCTLSLFMPRHWKIFKILEWFKK